MFTLLMTLFIIQQEVGTPVKTETFRIENIVTSEMCERGGKDFVKSHTGVATEPATETDDEEDKKKKKKDFELVRPAYVCIQTR